MKVICAWHEETFGEEFDMGERLGEAPPGLLPISHSICEECLARMVGERAAEKAMEAENGPA